MPKITYLERQKSGVYYYRRRIPKDCIAGFQGSHSKGIVKRSLRTKDFRTAQSAASILNVEMEQAFEKARGVSIGIAEHSDDRSSESKRKLANATKDILEEVKRALLRSNPDSDEKVERLIVAMSGSFPEACITNYEALINALELPDPNDRHVLAAAIKSGATHIVTENLKDFPREVAEDYDITPITVDDFLYNTYELYPEQAVSAILRHC